MNQMSILEDKVHKEYKLLTEFLVEHKILVSTMESCTGGLIASLITDTSGASEIMKGAFVTYCNEAKVLQGVPENIISEYGVYSLETASKMAEACSRTYSSEIGIGVTGTLGQADPNNADSIPGEVYISIYLAKDKTYAHKLEINNAVNRYEAKLMVADEIYKALEMIYMK